MSKFMFRQSSDTNKFTSEFDQHFNVQNMHHEQTGFYVCKNKPFKWLGYAKAPKANLKRQQSIMLASQRFSK